MINIHVHHTCISRFMANALRRAATQFYFVLLSSAWSKWRFYLITIFIIQGSTRQNMAAAWTVKISRPTRGKLQCNVCALLCSFFFAKRNDMIFGSVLERNCVTTFVVHTTLVISNLSLNGCSAAITFSNHCSFLLFADIIVHAWCKLHSQTLNVT